MTRKPKPMRLRDRVRASVGRNKKAYSIGAVVGAFLLLYPIVKEAWPMLEWLDSHWQKKTEAERHAASDRLEFARGELRDANAMEFMTRVRVIDCAAKTEKRVIARTEAEACKNYDLEHEKAVKRQEEVRVRLRTLREAAAQ